MDADIRLVPRNRGYYDVWLGGIELGVQIRLDDCGDLSQLVYEEWDRQMLREAFKREGLI